MDKFRLMFTILDYFRMTNLEWTSLDDKFILMFVILDFFRMTNSVKTF